MFMTRKWPVLPNLPANENFQRRNKFAFNGETAFANFPKGSRNIYTYIPNNTPSLVSSCWRSGNDPTWDNSSKMVTATVKCSNILVTIVLVVTTVVLVVAVLVVVVLVVVVVIIIITIKLLLCHWTTLLKRRSINEIIGHFIIVVVYKV